MLYNKSLSSTNATPFKRVFTKFIKMGQQAPGIKPNLGESLMRQKELSFNPRNLSRLRNWPVTPFCSPFLFCSPLSSKLKEGQVKATYSMTGRKIQVKKAKLHLIQRKREVKHSITNQGYRRKSTPGFLKAVKLLGLAEVEQMERGLPRFGVGLRL